MQLMLHQVFTLFNALDLAGLGEEETKPSVLSLRIRQYTITSKIRSLQVSDEPLF